MPGQKHVSDGQIFFLIQNHLVQMIAKKMAFTDSTGIIFILAIFCSQGLFSFFVNLNKTDSFFYLIFFLNNLNEGQIGYNG